MRDMYFWIGSLLYVIIWEKFYHNTNPPPFQLNFLKAMSWLCLGPAQNIFIFVENQVALSPDTLWLH